MNSVLIIGNGFDLYHGFPTTYKDFLIFIRKINKYYREHLDCFEMWNNSELKEIPFQELLRLEDSQVWTNCKAITLKKQDRHLLTAKEDNFWINHFMKIKRAENNWIDFETEIGKVVSIVKMFFEKNFESYITWDGIHEYEPHDRENYNRFYEIFMEVDENTLSKFGVNRLFNDRVRDVLKNQDFGRIKSQEERMLDLLREQLKDLKSSLKFYMKEVVSNLETNYCSKQVVSMKSVNVLNFNYTNFFDAIYPKQANETHYVHGFVDDEEIVLGCTRNSQTENEKGYLYFEKYFQRLQQKTGFYYRKWLDLIDDEACEVYIAGHSLDVVDMDLLSFFFEKDNVKQITILYHNQSDYESKIMNLIDQYGKDRLEDMLGTDKVIFKQWESRQKRVRTVT